MKKALIIGGSGFIGRHVTRLLCEAGRDVVVLGRRTKADRDLHPASRYVAGDYGDRSILRGVLKEGCDVVDLAYATVPKTSFEDPVFDLLANLPASVGLFQEALVARARRVVVVSSGGTVYGPAVSLPIKEEHPTNPVSPYGITKLATDRYAMMFHRNSGLPVVVVRPANAYGEEQRAGTGQGFIATAVEAICSGKEIVLFGEKGTVRDYIHVSDVATGILAALERGEDGEIYNIGTGVGSSNADILAYLAQHAGSRGIGIRTRVQPARLFDVEANVLNSGKLADIAGWHPSIAITDGLDRIWRNRKDKP